MIGPPFATNCSQNCNIQGARQYSVIVYIYITRKITLFQKLFEDLERSQLRQAFTEIQKHRNKQIPGALTHSERQRFWKQLTSPQSSVICSVKDRNTAQNHKLLKRIILSMASKSQYQAFQKWKAQIKAYHQNNQFVELTKETILRTQAEIVQNLRKTLQTRIDIDLTNAKQAVAEAENNGRIKADAEIMECKMQARQIATRRIRSRLISQNQLLDFHMRRKYACSPCHDQERRLSLKDYWAHQKLQQTQQYDKYYYAIDPRKAPKQYRDIQRFIVEYKLIKHVITLQRHFRRNQRRKLEKLKNEVSSQGKQSGGRLECLLF